MWFGDDCDGTRGTKFMFDGDTFVVELLNKSGDENRDEDEGGADEDDSGEKEQEEDDDDDGGGDDDDDADDNMRRALLLCLPSPLKDFEPNRTNIQCNCIIVNGAVEMHMDISQEPFCVEFTGKLPDANPVARVFAPACAIETHMDISQEPFL